MSCALPAFSTFQYTNNSRIRRLSSAPHQLEQLSQPSRVGVSGGQMPTDTEHDVGVLLGVAHDVRDLLLRMLLRQHERVRVVPEDVPHVRSLEAEERDRAGRRRFEGPARYEPQPAE